MALYTKEPFAMEDVVCNEWLGAYQRTCGLPAAHRIRFRAGTIEKDPVVLFKCKHHGRRFASGPHEEVAPPAEDPYRFHRIGIIPAHKKENP